MIEPMTPAATSRPHHTTDPHRLPGRTIPARLGHTASGTGGRCPTARALRAARSTTTTSPRTRDDISAASSLLRCAEGSPGEYEGLTRPGPARLDEPGDLIAAIPAMLGFEPERSLVLAVLCAAPGNPHSAVIDLVVRFDLWQPATGQPSDDATIAAAAARVCARPDVVGVLMVLVDEDLPDPEGSSPRPVPVLTALEGRLAAAAVPVQDIWATHSIGGGRPWWSLTEPGRRGRIADPAASRVTLDRVLDGRPIRRSRGELTALIAPDSTLGAQVSAELGAAQARAKDRYAAAALRANPIGFLHGELVTLLWLLSNSESGADLAPRELADIAVALRDRELRDCMFALAATGHAEAAEQLWARLTRALHGADRAETAMLLGYFAYVRGDGPVAGIALDAALDADPHHSMATLLHTALEAGMRPERLRDLAGCGRDCAATLGVDMDTARW